MEWTFVVTNKHVLDGATELELITTLKSDGTPNLADHYPVRITELQGAVTGHPEDNVDIALLNFSNVVTTLAQAGVDTFYAKVPLEAIPSASQLAELDAIEDIVFLGYPDGPSDEINQLPVARRGITATPLTVDFRGQPQFLIDAAVYPGSSGSPVFLMDRGQLPIVGSPSVPGTRVWLLGIVAGAFFQPDTGRVTLMDTPTQAEPVAAIRQWIDLGVIVKSRTIVETAVHAFQSRGKPLPASLAAALSNVLPVSSIS